MSREEAIAVLLLIQRLEGFNPTLNDMWELQLKEAKECITEAKELLKLHYHQIYEDTAKDLEKTYD